MNFLTPREILEAHDDIVRELGGEFGVLQEGAVHAAVERHQWGPFGVGDVEERAAFLLRGIAQDHPFVDGNKRTAFTVAGAFMRKNGSRIAASPDDVVQFMLDVAQSKYDLDGIAAWLRGHRANL